MSKIVFKLAWVRGIYRKEAEEADGVEGMTIEDLQNHLAELRWEWHADAKPAPANYTVRVQTEDQVVTPDLNTVIQAGQTYLVTVGGKGSKKRKVEEHADAANKGEAGVEDGIKAELGQLSKRGRPNSTHEWMAEGVKLRSVQDLEQAKKQMHSWETQMSNARKRQDITRLQELSSLHKVVSDKVKEYLRVHGATVSEHHQAGGTAHKKKVMQALNTIATAVTRREEESQQTVNTLVNYGVAAPTPSSSLVPQPSTPSAASDQPALTPQLMEEFKLFLAFRAQQQKALTEE